MHDLVINQAGFYVYNAHLRVFLSHSKVLVLTSTYVSQKIRPSQKGSNVTDQKCLTFSSRDLCFFLKITTKSGLFGKKSLLKSPSSDFSAPK